MEENLMIKPDAFADIKPPFATQDAALAEANRCLFCYDAPCIKMCPTEINIPKFIRQIANDDLKGSAHTILEANIFGAGCARVCPVEKLCEGSCVINLQHEKPVDISRLQRYATDHVLYNDIPLFERLPINGKRVAVVGAGPAGLSCAHGLSRMGVQVTVFEKEAEPGGLMRYGVAAYKANNDFAKEETDYILSLGGIEVQYGTTLGKDVSLETLQQQYDAVFLGMGVGLTRPLGIPGEDLDGVTDAIDFIYKLRKNGPQHTPVPAKTTVIGMGMTAIDAATQAKRLGAVISTMVYRRTSAQMPCTRFEYQVALLDGCRIVWLAAPKQILGEDGKVTALICDIMELGPPDESGRSSPLPTGEELTVKTDWVIKAIGQTPYLSLVQELGLEHQEGRVVVKDNYATNLPGVFAGGDCVNGGMEVVNAVQHGKQAARAILEYMGIGGSPSNSKK